MLYLHLEPISSKHSEYDSKIHHEMSLSPLKTFLLNVLIGLLGRTNALPFRLIEAWAFLAPKNVDLVVSPGLSLHMP
jgi:hypothetical protein